MSIKNDNTINMAQDSVITTITPMQIEDGKTWYNASEKYDSWYEVAETMENNQEWVDPPTISGDTDKTEPRVRVILRRRSY